MLGVMHPKMTINNESQNQMNEEIDLSNSKNNKKSYDRYIQSISERESKILREKNQKSILENQ